MLTAGCLTRTVSTHHFSSVPWILLVYLKGAANVDREKIIGEDYYQTTVLTVHSVKYLEDSTKYVNSSAWNGHLQ